MISKKPAPALIRGGCRFSEKIMLQRKNIAPPRRGKPPAFLIVTGVAAAPYFIIVRMPKDASAERVNRIPAPTASSDDQRAG